MRALAATDIIDLWERARDDAPFDRAVTLLAAARPDLTHGAVLAMPVGERDANLLELHERLFGSSVSACVDCPHCAEKVEFSLCTSDLPRVPTTSHDDRFALDVGNLRLLLRHPSSGDLLAVGTMERSEAAHDLLARRCVVQADLGGTTVAPAELPANVLPAIVAQLGIADPRADVQLGVECPACARRSSVVFDIVTHLWAMVAAEARRLLREVDTIARCYGWSEREILALSARRRWSYLELARG